MEKLNLLRGLQDACAFIFSHRETFTNWSLIDPEDFIEKLTFLYDNAGTQVREILFELGSNVH